MDQIGIGRYIRALRTGRGMTQKDLADRLGVSFQAVSKWELGETLPDPSLLVELGDLLGVSVDKLLRAGAALPRESRRMAVEDVLEGFAAMEKVGDCLGRQSLFYIGMVNGINRQMNMDLEAHLADPAQREFLYAEVMLQAVDSGCTFDMDDVRAHIRSPKIWAMVEKRMAAGQGVTPSSP